MSEHKLFTKLHAGEISAEFQQFEKKKNVAKRKQTMKKVIANITMGNHDMINVFPEVIKLFDSDDIEIKRMCYHYLGTYALAKPDVALSLLPSVMTDLKSDSPIIVALALRNLCSVPINEYIRESISPLRFYMSHKDPYLRKIALICVARVHEKNPQLVQSEGLIRNLYDALKDPNPTVVSGSLTALYDITERSKDINLKLSRNQALDIADLLSKSDEWSQSILLNTLMSFVPQTNEDSMILIDKSISLLQHSNSAVVLNAFKLLLYLLNYVDVIEDYITRKLASSLTSLLSKPAEIQFLVLRNVILLILSKPKLIPFDVTAFFCEYNDPIYVKDTKLEIIYLLANESNADVVLKELEEYGTDVDVQMSRKAIRAIGNLAVKLAESSKHCVDVLLSLASNGIDYVVQEAVLTFKNVLRRYDNFNYIVPELLQYIDKVEEPEARASLIWIVGQYCDSLPKAESVLADLTFTFQEDPYDVQLASLTAAVKLFLRKPEVGQPLVIKLLKWATEKVDHPDVRDRGFFYWRLLASQDRFPGTAKDIVDSKVPPISSENDQLDPVILEELELNMGTLASIYLKPVGQVFRLSKRKLLTYSPAKSLGSAKVASSSNSDLSHPIRRSTVSSMGSGSQDPGHVERHIDDYDVPAVNVKSVKKQSGLSRRLTMGKSSLSRKLSIRGFN